MKRPSQHTMPRSSAAKGPEDFDMVSILHKAKIIKARPEALNQSNIANCSLSARFGEVNPVNQTRISVTNGLRTKLKEMMNVFQSLRKQILAKHKEALKRKYFNAIGVGAKEVIEKMLSSGNQVGLLDKKGEVDLGIMDRRNDRGDIQRSLMQLYQVFFPIEEAALHGCSSDTRSKLRRKAMDSSDALSEQRKKVHIRY